MEFSQFLSFTIFTLILAFTMGLVALPLGWWCSSMATLLTLAGGLTVLVLTVRK